ncbi:MAG: hypothetical protein IGS03_03100 [Candidatus Sericytochromatia bacterium]|nr:hypothetical protein [Candidatus Sericytochromatia bacterium]
MPPSAAEIDAARLSVQSDTFSASLQAATDGSVSGQVSLSTDALRLVAEVAYKDMLSARLGVESEHINLAIATDGSQLNWSVTGGSDLIRGGLTGQNDQLSGTLQLGDATLALGWHDVSVRPSDDMMREIEAQGGEAVQMDMYGATLRYDF